jgi:hypothetical protein
VSCRDGFERALDAYCGLCILVLYFLYLTLVRGAFSVFDCSTNADGARILDADPSIVCDEVYASTEYSSARLQSSADHDVGKNSPQLSMF